MKPKYKIISLSVLAGMGYWIADAVFDFFFFYEEPFLDLLIFDVPVHDIYIRLVGLGLFFIFGITLSKIIIKHQRAEKNMKKSEEELHLLSSMVKQSDEGMVLTDLNGNLLFLNDAFAAMHGYISEKLVGRHVSAFHTQEQMPSVEAATRQTKETGSFSGEVWAIRRDGTTFPTLINNSLLHDEAGNPIGMIGLARDITERKHMEDELKVKDNALKSSVNAIGFADLEGKVTYVNSSFLKMCGYDNESEVLGKTILKLGFDENAFLKSEEAMRNKGGWVNETIVKRKDGSTFDAQISVSMLRDKNNKSIGTMASFIDITERKHMENELKVKDHAIATSINGIGLADLEGKITYVNSSHLKIYGYDNENELLGKSVLAFGFDKKVPVKMFEIVQKEGGWIGEMIAKRKNGSAFPVQMTISLVRDEHNKPLCMMASITDITERKKMEDELKVKDQAIATSINGIGLSDLKGKVTYVNSSYLKMYGYDNESEVLGKSILEFGFKKEEVMKIVETMKKEGRKDGSAFHIQMTISMVKDEHNKPLCMMASFVDITERKKLGEELQKMQKLESVGVLAGGIAHDFNNLLTAIIGNLSLIELYAESGGNILEVLEETKRASQQTRRLTQQLLTFSTGGEPIKKGVSIVELLKDTAGLALSGSNVICEFSLPDDLWWAEVDEGQIDQAINNLIINANQAMAKGGTIRIWAENMIVGAEKVLSLKEGKYVKISIKDQGTGIKEEYLQKIFDPYFTTKQAGNGLGLAITHSIINKHGGYITVESEIEAGTTFTIFLPAFEKKTFMVKDIEEELIYKGKGNILFMDDKENIKNMVKHMLNHLGYEVELATDGAEAIELYKEAKASGQGFDAVILDLTIPGGMGGVEAIGKLYEIDPEIKAIVSSGYANDPIMSGYEANGFKGAIAKPYEVEELSKILNEVLRAESPRLKA